MQIWQPEPIKPAPMIWVPRFETAKNPGGIIPPSPPAEIRVKNRAAWKKELHSYTGRLDPLFAAGRTGGSGFSYPQNVSRQYPQHPLGSAAPPAGLVFSYSLDTTSWTDNLGTNNMTGTGSPGVVAGKISNAIQCDGSTKYIGKAYNAAFNLSGSTATITAWAYVANTTNTGRVIAKNSLSFTDWEILYSQPTNKWQIGFSNAAGTGGFKRADTFGTISTNTWYWIVMQASGGNCSISVNNGAFDSATCTGGLHNDVTAGVDIGHEPAVGNFFWGNIDETNGWNIALSGAQLTTLYNGSTGLAYPYAGV